MHTNEPRITITGLASSGPTKVYLESAGEAYLDEMAGYMTDLPEDATPAQREARMDAIMAAYTKLNATGSTVDAAGLTHLRLTADGKGMEPVRAKTMAQMAERYWAKHGGARKVDTDDGIDRSISGSGPGYEMLKRIVGAKPRPRGR